MNKLISRGALIVLEGCDRSGKTTQAKLMIENLNKNGTKVEFMRFPERSSAIGGIIDNYLKCTSELDDRAIHLLFSANRWEFAPKIKRLLNEGTSIIIDRYAFSGAAFSAAKEGLDLKWCQQCDVGLPRPDLVIFFELSPEAAKSRGEYGEERYEKKEFQERVTASYDKLRDETWQKVDADKSIEEVQSVVLELVKDAIKNVENKPVGKLWT